MKLPKIDLPGWFLAIAFAVVGVGSCVGASCLPVEQPPKKLATLSPFASVAEYGETQVSPAANSCRLQGGSPFGIWFCDFGPCPPRQPVHLPCSVHTLACDGNACDWGKPPWIRWPQ